MDRIGQLEVFIAIAEAGTISGGARALGLSIAVASRSLAALEERLGVELARRNTRTLTLTEEGSRFLLRARNVLSDIADSEAEVVGTRLDPSGLLRVSASLSFGMLHIAPRLYSYRARYPKVRVHLEISNRYVDLIEAGIDVAIRNRQFEPDSNITIQRLGETCLLLAASPQYLLAAGRPEHPRDLERHALLLYTHATIPNTLSFSRNEETVHVTLHGLLESNDGQILRAAALTGLGLIAQPSYLLHADIAAGRLVPVLGDWEMPRLTINLAYPTRKYLSAKTRSFIEFMRAEFEAHNYTELWTAHTVPRPV